MTPAADSVGSPFPLDVIFRHRCGTEDMEAFVREMAVTLGRFGDQITHCRVVVDECGPHDDGKQRYRLSINTAIPGGSVLVGRQSDIGAGYEDPYLTIRRAFAAAGRQLRARLANRE